MAQPNSRQTLIDYTLRNLGGGVIRVNVSQDQAEDRLDEAIQYYQTFHKDGTVRCFLKHQVTQEDITNHYVKLNSDVLIVHRLLRFGPLGASAQNLFDFRYQYAVNDLFAMGNYTGSLTNYQMLRTQLSTMEWLFNVEHTVEFQVHGDICYIAMDWAAEVSVGDWLVFECEVVVDPEKNTSVYNDLWLKRYYTALMQRQWGANLKKFAGVQLSGGIQLNGDKIYEDAVQEIKDLEKECSDRFSGVPQIMMG